MNKCGKRDEKQNRPDNPACKLLVARTRFELVISALRGRRPEPLDERAICDEARSASETLGSPYRIRTGDLRLERAAS